MSQVPERKEAEKVKPAKWQNYTLALQQNAHKQGKPVIIDFSAEW
jgi:thiol:disulfide interchange protein